MAGYALVVIGGARSTAASARYVEDAVAALTQELGDPAHVLRCFPNELCRGAPPQQQQVLGMSCMRAALRLHDV